MQDDLRCQGGIKPGIHTVDMSIRTLSPDIHARDHDEANSSQETLRALMVRALVAVHAHCFAFLPLEAFELSLCSR